MGQDASRDIAEQDKAKMDRFLAEYEIMNEHMPNILDATLYKKKHAYVTQSGHVPAVLMKRYVFMTEDKSSRFAEDLKMRKGMPVRHLPKLQDYFMRIDNGYCQVFYTFHVAFEFITFNLEKELQLRSKNAQANKVPLL
jgi:hypothetical protein